MAIGGSTSPTKTNINAVVHEVDDRQQVNRLDDNNPGVRLIGNRIYCPLNGKTCHQCRQKTLDLAAFCKNLKGNKVCTIKFCHKCLKNRYGENASNVSKLGDWKCPKCRGICNCSFCMKKRGQKPTGILVHAAKSNGFGSVSEMLSLGSPDGSNKDHALRSPRKPSKENSPPKSNALNLGEEGRLLNANKASSKKRNFEGPVAIDNNFSVSDALRDKAGNINYCVTKEGKKSKVADSTELARSEKFSASHEPVQRDEEVSAEVEAGDPIKENKSSVKLPDINNLFPGVPLPQGTILTSVCAMELPVEVIGDSLQFLEFCSAFGKGGGALGNSFSTDASELYFGQTTFSTDKNLYTPLHPSSKQSIKSCSEALNLRKGEAEVIVRELLSGRPKRNGRESSLVRIHIKLLSIIRSSNVNSTARGISWLRDLEKCVSQSAFALKGLSRCSFDGGLSDYDELDLIGKFRLLNFLCDEALDTEPFRSWIEEQNQKFLENGKKSKEKLVAAKDKEKHLKQKLLGKVTQAVIAKNGVPLSITEHEAVVAKVKHEIAVARDELASIADRALKKQQRSDAVRTQPIFVDPRGSVFWKLSASIGESDVLRQDLTSSDSDEYEEKWLSFDDREKEAVDKYISSRMRSFRIQKVNAQTTNLECGYSDKA